MKSQMTFLALGAKWGKPLGGDQPPDLVGAADSIAIEHGTEDQAGETEPEVGEEGAAGGSTTARIA